MKNNCTLPKTLLGLNQKLVTTFPPEGSETIWQESDNDRFSIELFRLHKLK